MESKKTLFSFCRKKCENRKKSPEPRSLSCHCEQSEVIHLFPTQKLNCAPRCTICPPANTGAGSFFEILRNLASNLVFFANTSRVIPAKVLQLGSKIFFRSSSCHPCVGGDPELSRSKASDKNSWIPACAGMTRAAFGVAEY